VRLQDLFAPALAPVAPATPPAVKPLVAPLGWLERRTFPVKLVGRDWLVVREEVKDRWPCACPPCGRVRMHRWRHRRYVGEIGDMSAYSTWCGSCGHLIRFAILEPRQPGQDRDKWARRITLVGRNAKGAGIRD
jgi:hypothetical protein